MKSHVGDENDQVFAAGKFDGWNIELTAEPENSMDIKVMDFCF